MNLWKTDVGPYPSLEYFNSLLGSCVIIYAVQKYLVSLSDLVSGLPQSSMENVRVDRYLGLGKD